MVLNGPVAKESPAQLVLRNVVPSPQYSFTPLLRLLQRQLAVKVLAPGDIPNLKRGEVVHESVLFR
jgi:hypothetical protein